MWLWVLEGWTGNQGAQVCDYDLPRRGNGLGDLWLWAKTLLTSHSELAREKMWARIHLIPALQAEEDRDQVRRYLADKAREKELLGSETKVYNSDRYIADTEYPKEHQANQLITGSSGRPSLSRQSTRRNKVADNGC